MKLAVNVVVVEDAVTVCEIAPPSDQAEKVSCVPARFCGEVVAMVWLAPTVQVRVCGAE